MKCLSLGVVRHVKAYLICSLGIKKSLFYGDVLIKCFWFFFCGIQSNCKTLLLMHIVAYFDSLDILTK